MLHDPWLDRWLPDVVAAAGADPVFEIGCGHGADTATLARAGLRVIAIDLTDDAVRTTRRKVPTARVERQDVREPFPDGVAGLGVVVASLSLHYFAWPETQRLAARIHAVLRPGGLLLCRLNSTADVHFGASGHPPIEPGLFLVDGAPKRFFDETAVRALFATGWTFVGLQHITTHKYVRSKALWEAVLRRSA